MRLSEILDILCTAFPLEQAESWDASGLSVGDPHAEVTHVACALDALPSTIARAHELGCSLLVTHHPAFLTPPFPVTPDVQTSSLAAATLTAAVQQHVALIGMHTNLDISCAALDVSARLLHVPRTGRLFEPDGFGAVLDVDDLTLDQLCGRCADAFGCQPRVWGDATYRPHTVAFCSGSLGSFGRQVLDRSLGAVITGEAGYHHLLELSCGGVGAILLGHDASEFPFAQLLADTLIAAASDLHITVIEEGLRWHAWAGQE